ncbi:unnamed protein product [Ectocarpus fasciculatus]
MMITTTAAPVHQHQLPVHAAIEGPAACFRLLEINTHLGMKHDQFVGLLLSATDNRLSLEDIHEAWKNNADISEGVEPVEDGRQDHHGHPEEAVGLLLPSFVRAFTALARTKYSDRPHDGESRDSVNRLLLRDVLEIITNSTPSVSARYGVCSHLVREDVCSFLLSKRPFTTYLFAVYAGESSASPQRQGNSDATQDWTRSPSPRQGSKEQTMAISKTRRIHWAGFLAASSDLQLVPRLMGLDALKAAVEQVSVAPHRLERGNGQPSSHRNSAAMQRSAAGMSYPQFVEVLSLMAISAAGRLRRLYPDVAGPEPLAAVVDPRPRNTPTNSTSDGTTSRGGGSRGGGGPLALEIASEAAGRSADKGEAGEDSGNARSLFQRKARHVRAAMRLRLKKGRSLVEAPRTPKGPPVDEQTEEVPPPCDVGALKALFHHAETAHEEKCCEAARPQGFHRRSLSRSSLSSPACRRDTMATKGDGASERSSPWSNSSSIDAGSEPSDCGGNDDEGRGEGRAIPAVDYEGAAAAAAAAAAEVRDDSKILKQRVFSPQESARVLEEIRDRVSDLEAKVLPREQTSEVETGADGTGSEDFLPRRDDHARAVVVEEEETGPERLAPGAGGGFARLVVIKELQPVPEHAPEDASHLLDLTLDHHQAGRYALALETLEKGVIMWEELQGGGEGEHEPADPEHGLDAPDEALVLLIEASIYQSAGRDDDALSTLLRAEEEVTYIDDGDSFLRETLLASVLSEMGVTLYYSSQTTLSLRCFRLALVVRHSILSRSSEHHTETGELASDVEDGWKNRAHSYGTPASRVAAAEAGEAAAAIALNNVAACLAGAAETFPAAVQALEISSTITTSALGVEHPRSTIVSRNLALLKAVKCRGRRSSRESGRPALQRWEKDMWRSLGSRQWTSHHADAVDDLVLYNGVAQRTSRVIPGGFVFAGKLPPAIDSSKTSRSKGRGKKKGAKKRGKSARRR